MTDEFVTFPKPNDPLPDHRVLELYLAGECTVAERIAMERWIKANPYWQEVLRVMALDGRTNRLLAQGESVSKIDQFADAIFREAGIATPSSISFSNDDIKQAVGYRQLVSNPKMIRAHTGAANHNPWVWASRKLYSRLPFPATKPATAGVFGVICSVVVFLVFATMHHLGAKDIVPTGNVTRQAFSIYTTGNGQRATITLADGSTVLLSVASRLEVPVDYHLGNRALRLEGAAMFSVRPSSLAPFTVTARGITTRVLGTTFIMRRYSSDSSAIVAVRDGKVSVQGIVVAASQRVSVDTQKSIVPHNAHASDFDFFNGMLRLDQMPLSRAIPELNRWYDAEIRLGDSSLANEQITGGFKNGSLTDLITILEKTLSVQVFRDGKVLNLYPKL